MASLVFTRPERNELTAAPTRIAAMAENGYLLFVWKSSGYELEERSGEPPKPGDEVEVGEQTQLVTKVAPSPLPGDSRPCAYLQAR